MQFIAARARSARDPIGMTSPQVKQSARKEGECRIQLQYAFIAGQGVLRMLIPFQMSGGAIVVRGGIARIEAQGLVVTRDGFRESHQRPQAVPAAIVSFTPVRTQGHRRIVCRESGQWLTHVQERVAPAAVRVDAVALQLQCKLVAAQGLLPNASVRVTRRRAPRECPYG